MIKKILGLLLFVFIAAGCPEAARADQRAWGKCWSNTAPATQFISTQCTVTVYVTGTLNLATIYSDNSSTPKSNPFASDANGVWFFYAANGRYDVRLSAGNPAITPPYTIADILLDDGGGGGGTGCTLENTSTTEVLFNNADACDGDPLLTWQNARAQDANGFYPGQFKVGDSLGDFNADAWTYGFWSNAPRGSFINSSVAAAGTPGLVVAQQTTTAAVGVNPLYVFGYKESTGTGDGGSGGEFRMVTNLALGQSVSSIRALRAIATATGEGTTTAVTGIWAQADADESAVVSSVTSLLVAANDIDNAATVTNSYGIVVQTQDNTATNRYGVWLDNQGGTATEYNLWSDGTNSKSHFSGYIEISGLAADPNAAANKQLLTASSGSPEGAVTAPIGSVYLRSDGGSGTSIYTKTSGSGNTGWEPLATSAGISWPLTSDTANPADAGQIRFAVSDDFAWRNNANDGNLLLSVDASDLLTFSGGILCPQASSTTQVLFNTSGSCDGNAKFTFDDTNARLHVGDTIAGLSSLFSAYATAEPGKVTGVAHTAGEWAGIRGFAQADTDQGGGHGGIFMAVGTVAQTGPEAISGLNVEAASSHAMGTTDKLYGMYVNTQLTGAGTVGDNTGIFIAGSNTSTGTIGTHIGARIGSFSNSGGGTVTNNYGVQIDGQQNGGTNSYALFIADQGTGANNYAVYISGGKFHNLGTFSAPLIPSAVNSIDLGSAAVPWRNLFLGDAANNSVSFDTSNLTGDRVIEIPDDDGLWVIATGAIMNGNCAQFDITGGVTTLIDAGTTCGGGGGTGFASITNGTNNSAAMVIDTGASLTTTNNGTLEANALRSGSLTSAQVATAVSDETGTPGNLVFSGSPTIVTPTIASFTNATHDHEDAAGGGQLTDAALSAAVTVPKGGTGLTSGTSGGVPYFSASTTITSSAALAANQIVLGGGAGAAPATLGSLGTTTTVLHGNAAGAPSFSAVVAADLPSEVVYTNQNATFGAFAYNFTSATSLRVPNSSGATVSATGQIAHDTNVNNWHVWNGADRIMGIWSSTPTNGNCLSASVSASQIMIADSGAACGGLPSTGSTGIVVQTGASTTVARTMTGTSPITVTNGSGVSGAPDVSCSTCTTASNTQTFTNKTYNQEGSGNVMTTVATIYLDAASVSNSTAATGLDLGTSNIPTANALNGANTFQGTLDYDDASDKSGQFKFALPSTWTGAVDADLYWLVTSGGAVNAVKWTLATACSAPGATYDTAFNSAQTVTTNTQSNNLVTRSTQTGMTMTGCAGNSLLHIKIGRDTTDTFTGTARLLGVRITLRKTGA